ncbi:Anaphase-promoting complex subunit 2 [Labeo rohita]|uniref:Anaphase-promoting complex subunit 2 n=1 Tax=Labeo rohita TaxID=84645 RepID=A0ABQ8MMY9_LABRO|nr:Anaphase-promoting complex subunit 2 [Labeo rohita]
MNEVQLMPQGLSAAWDTVTSALVSAVPPNASTDEVLSEALTLLGVHGLGQYVEGWLLETLQVRLTTSVAPEFWTGLKQPEGESQERHRAKALLEAFRNLLQELQPFLDGLERLGSWQDESRGGLSGPGARGLTERAFSVIRAILLFSPPPVLQERVLEFYSRTFSVHMSQAGEAVEAEEGTAEHDEGGLCPGCATLPHLCCSRLQLLERVSSEAVTSILHQLIEQRMEQRCRGEYESSFLTDFNDWLGQVLGWLSRVFASKVEEVGSNATPTGGTTGQPANALLQRWHCHMHQFFCRIYVNMRIEELFSIIRDFPESIPAIEDLKFCLERTNQRQQLLASLKSAFETRLLHPGVHTSDIITVYISAIKALRELDPSMVILQVACQPIRKYLRTREDTVRQIVGSLTGDAEGCTDLANELSRADPVTLETQDSEDEGNKTGSKRRSSDIISLLVSIYGSKEIFINEYKTVLADRLLHQLNYNTAREIRNVELLKLRFGESHMHYCEVMLKDVADSRRINTNIREEDSRLPVEEQSTLPLSAMIISSEFWPQLKEEKMELPTAMRTLRWKPHLGTWTLEELSSVLGVPQEMVRRKLALWQQQGVVREEAGGRYTVQETSSCRERSDRSVMLIDSDEEGDSNTATQSEQREEKLQLFWAYIQAMLTNLESMTLERIHSMLRMFVAAGSGVTEMDVNELQAFLQKKVRAHQLIVSTGVYRLPKTTQ